MDDIHLKEQTVSREELLDGHFLHVVRDTVRLPDGATATREFVLHPGAVAVVPLLEDGRIVLERQYRHPTGRVMIELPAGKLDAGEGALVCGQRELLEEFETLSSKENSPQSSGFFARMKDFFESFGES